MLATDFQKLTPLQIIYAFKALIINNKIPFECETIITSDQNISLLVNDVSDFSLSLIG